MNYTSQSLSSLLLDETSFFIIVKSLKSMEYQKNSSKGQTLVYNNESEQKQFTAKGAGIVKGSNIVFNRGNAFGYVLEVLTDGKIKVAYKQFVGKPGQPKTNLETGIKTIQTKNARLMDEKEKEKSEITKEEAEYIESQDSKHPQKVEEVPEAIQKLIDALNWKYLSGANKILSSLSEEERSIINNLNEQFSGRKPIHEARTVFVKEGTWNEAAQAYKAYVGEPVEQGKEYLANREMQTKFEKMFIVLREVSSSTHEVNATIELQIGTQHIEYKWKRTEKEMEEERQRVENWSPEAKSEVDVLQIEDTDTYDIDIAENLNESVTTTSKKVAGGYGPEEKALYENIKQFDEKSSYRDCFKDKAWNKIRDLPEKVALLFLNREFAGSRIETDATSTTVETANDEVMRNGYAPVSSISSYISGKIDTAREERINFLMEKDKIIWKSLIEERKNFLTEMKKEKDAFSYGLKSDKISFERRITERESIFDKQDNTQEERIKFDEKIKEERTAFDLELKDYFYKFEDKQNIKIEEYKKDFIEKKNKLIKLMDPDSLSKNKKYTRSHKAKIDELVWLQSNQSFGSSVVARRGNKVQVVSAEKLFWDRFKQMNDDDQVKFIEQSTTTVNGKSSIEMASALKYNVNEKKDAERLNTLQVQGITFHISSEHAYKFHEQDYRSHPGLAGTQKEIELAIMLQAYQRYKANALPRSGAVGGISESKYFVTVNGIKIKYLAWSPKPGSGVIYISDYMAEPTDYRPTSYAAKVKYSTNFS